MATTHQDNDHEDQEDDMRQDDIPSHLSHPGTETTENPNEFHKNTNFKQGKSFLKPNQGNPKTRKGRTGLCTLLGASASSKPTTKSAQPHLSRSNGGHPQREGTNLGVFVPIWLVLPGCEATNLGVFDICVISQKNLRAYKNKIGTSPSPQKPQIPAMLVLWDNELKCSKCFDLPG